MVAHLECNEVDLGFALAAEGLIDAHRDDDPAELAAGLRRLVEVGSTARS